MQSVPAFRIITSLISFAISRTMRTQREFSKTPSKAKTPIERKRKPSAAFVMLHLARLYAKKGWTMQIHLGPRQQLEPIDPILRTGCGHRLDRRLAAGRKDGPFPGSFGLGECSSKTIVYNNNPSDNFTVATMLGNFQREVPGKMQFRVGLVAPRSA